MSSLKVMVTGPTDIAAAVTYSPERDRFLLLKRGEDREVFPGRWDFPSGRIEDEEPDRAALRELREETGLLGEVMRSGEPFPVETDYGEFVVHPFLVRVGDEEVELSGEHSESRWVDREEIRGMDTVKSLEKDLERVDVI
ncbi:MAG: NUDIX domain-containing protein [Candidatus Nanohaloarchaea archaeon]